MKYFVYIIKSEKRGNWSYVGYTSDLSRRFLEHCKGKVVATKGFRPLILVYFEEYSTEQEAYEREQYLKTGLGREEKALILKDHSEVV